jgi:hypothetical protein
MKLTGEIRVLFKNVFGMVGGVNHLTSDLGVAWIMLTTVIEKGRVSLEPSKSHKNRNHHLSC